MWSTSRADGAMMTGRFPPRGKRVGKFAFYSVSTVFICQGIHAWILRRFLLVLMQSASRLGNSAIGEVTSPSSAFRCTSRCLLLEVYAA